MSRRHKINIELVKLTSGARLLRLSSSASPLVLEQQLDPKQAVLAQKKRLLPAFEAALAQAASSHP